MKIKMKCELEIDYTKLSIINSINNIKTKLYFSKTFIILLILTNLKFIF
jgi:hypothetical protein